MYKGSVAFSAGCRSGV